MTRDEAAAALNGCEYRSEGSRDLFAAMKSDYLVAVFGASDDLTELRGAIDDELGSGVFYVDHIGLIKSECEEGEDCPYFKRLITAAPKIDPQWDQGDWAWSYKTDIPHATFDVREDGEPYCKGIVFSLNELVAA